jgi:hypothetical protein
MSILVDFDIVSFIQNLPTEKRSEVYDYLGLEHEVIENVVTMLVNGETKAGSWVGDSSSTMYPCAIDTARRYIATHAEALTKERNIELQRKLDELVTAHKTALEELNVYKEREHYARNRI